jgi:hypothetical protein
MTAVHKTAALKAPAQEVWSLIGGFNALPDWHPAVERSEERTEGPDRLRTLSLRGGGSIVERLVKHDDQARAYSYAIVSSPLPVENYRSEIRVRDDGDGRGCIVEWQSEFAPSGASEADAVAAIGGVYEAGLDNLRKRFGG